MKNWANPCAEVNMEGITRALEPLIDGGSWCPFY